MLTMVAVSIMVSAKDESSSTTEPFLLVGNTCRGDCDSSIVKYGLKSGTLDVFIAGGILDAPDHMAEYDGYFYISTGEELYNSAIVRVPTSKYYTGVVDEEGVEVFAEGGGLKRPYGFDIHQDTLYVSSFMTDQILMYNSITGQYIGVFAEGNRTEEGLCNGPNQIEIYQGKLYMTTEGSYIDDNGDVQFAFASQVVVYDLENGKGEVFIPQPDPSPDGQGYVSMFGLMIGCDKESVLEDDCTVYTTDFAGGLRLYSFSDQTLVDDQSTTYSPGSTTGSLTMSEDRTIYVPGYLDEDSGGVIMSFQPDLDPANNDTSSLIFEDESGVWFRRPLGILYVAGFANPGANKGKYYEGNAKGIQNGIGFGVGKDPKACANKSKKHCKKDDACKWDDDACVTRTAVFPLMEQIANEFQPSSASASPHGISAAIIILAVMWYTVSRI